jgi:hypothetical protein
MSLFGYAAFWLIALAILLTAFDLLYGRHFRAVVRALLTDTDVDQKSGLLEHIIRLLQKFWEVR